MTQAASRSLLDFLAAPVVVGDPDGNAVYVNPHFEEAFQTSGDSARGKPLAGLFQGGAREAVLRAVAEVCGGSSPVRFRLREGDVGYAALASPIEAEQGRVGVLILLAEELHLMDVGPVLQRDIEEPLEDIAHCLQQLGDIVGGRRGGRSLEVLEDAARALERMRKSCEAWRTTPPARR